MQARWTSPARPHGGKVKYRLQKVDSCTWRVRQASELAHMFKDADPVVPEDEWFEVVTPEAERIGEEFKQIADQVGIESEYRINSNTTEPDDAGYIYLRLSLRFDLFTDSRKELEAFVLVAALNDYDCINQQELWKEF